MSRDRLRKYFTQTRERCPSANNIHYIRMTSHWTTDRLVKWPQRFCVARTAS